MAPTLPLTTLPPLEVFAVDANSAQICWRDLPTGTLTAMVDGRETTLGDAGRPGVGDISELAAGTTHRVDLHIDGQIIWRSDVRTGDTIPGSMIAKVATISDLHLGEARFGLTRTMRDRSGAAEPYTLRCAIAAVGEAAEWGADLLVLKGDITHSGLPDQWELFDRLLAHVEVPIMVLPGNHDVVGTRGFVDHRTALESRGIDNSEVQVGPLGGATTVAVDSTIARRGSGTFDGRLDQVLSAIDTASPVLMLTHHHFELAPIRYFWPPGVPLAESTRFLRTVAETNADTALSSGHTHRNRARNVNGMLVTEVSSVKDHPGVWAGYEIHAAGIRQTVRRVADPDCVRWTEQTRQAVAGIWGRWAPGTLGQRSLVHRWPSTLESATQSASESRILPVLATEDSHR